jgi:hypothetical protein
MVESVDVDRIDALTVSRRRDSREGQLPSATMPAAMRLGKVSPMPTRDKQRRPEHAGDVAVVGVGLGEPAEPGQETAAAGQHQRAHTRSRQQGGGQSRDHHERHRRGCPSTFCRNSDVKYHIAMAIPPNSSSMLAAPR